jgi:hypothetical protein
MDYNHSISEYLYVVEAKFTRDLCLDENLSITHNVGTGCRYILK